MNSQASRILALGYAVAALQLLAQVPVAVQKAELSVPFGVAAGRLVTVGEYLVFLDDEKPEASFAVPHENVREFSANIDLLSLETAKPIRDRSGERSKLTFRISTPEDAPKLTAWLATAPSPGTPSTKAESAAAETYQVKHDHLIGSCSGRLILEPDRIVFESITDLNHSRQWGLRDIKEVKRDNPYGIKIVPFSGDTYNLEIQGRGMDSNAYRALVDRITAARLQK